MNLFSSPSPSPSYFFRTAIKMEIYNRPCPFYFFIFSICSGPCTLGVHHRTQQLPTFIQLLFNDLHVLFCCAYCHIIITINPLMHIMYYNFLRVKKFSGMVFMSIINIIKMMIKSLNTGSFMHLE